MHSQQPGPTVGPPRRSPRDPVHLSTTAVLLALAIFSAGCASSGKETPGTRQPWGARGSTTTVVEPSPTTGHDQSAEPRATPDPNAFDETDAAFRRRVAEASLAGGALYVVRDGAVVYDGSVGSVTRATPMAVASAAKWFTSALLMTLVDDGAISLDEPISRYLPEFAGEPGASGGIGSITLRQLLNHTSGITQQSCIWDTSAVMAECVARLAGGSLEFAPGMAFSYGNAGYHVAGHLAEVVSGTDFQTLFARRIADPLGLTSTSWGGGPNPSPAAGATTTVDDYARFLAMMLAGGVHGGHRVLSEQSVAEVQRNQVAGYDTSRDYAVGITRIPTYGLGLWRDVVDDHDEAVVVSGNGALGFYPWIDHDNDAYGVLAVQDRRGAEVAVPASKKVVVLAVAATPRT